jgi:iron complex outermembrane recepter protein
MPDGQGQASTISLPSAQRIEVLRGPLAQFYGNCRPGGVLQVFTADGPAKRPELRFSVRCRVADRPAPLRPAGGGAERFALNYVIDHSDFLHRRLARQQRRRAAASQCPPAHPAG